MTSEDFVTWLRSAHADFGDLPAGLQHGTGRIAGTAFFPGGDGLVRPRPSEVLPDVMVIGRDFGTLEYLETCVRLGQETTTQATWRPLLSLFEAAQLAPTRVFFSNLFLGYRETGSNVDEMPAHGDPLFIERSLAFVERQIEVLAPQTIVTLGKAVPRLLGSRFAGLRSWSLCKGFAAIDRAGPVVRDAAIGTRKASVCALVHPSKSWLNIDRRRYVNSGGVETRGVAAELAMLLDVLDSSGR